MLTTGAETTGAETTGGVTTGGAGGVGAAATGAVAIGFAAGAADHRRAGGDVLDQLAGHAGDPDHGAAAGVDHGQGGQALPPHQPSHPGKQRAVAAACGPVAVQPAGSEGLWRAGCRTQALYRAGQHPPTATGRD